MLPAKYFCSTKALLMSIELNGDHKTACKDKAKFGHPQFWGHHQISNSDVCLSDDHCSYKNAGIKQQIIKTMHQ